MKINVLFYYHNMIIPSVGGVERVVNTMYHELTKLNYNIISVYCFKAFGDPQFNQIELPNKSRKSKENRDFLKEIIKEKNINIILNFSATSNKSSFDITRAATSCKVPIIAVYHNQIDYQLWTKKFMVSIKKYNILYSILETLLKIYQRFVPYQGSFIARSSDAAVVLSSSYVEQLRYTMSLSKDYNIISIPNPSPFGILTSLNKEPNMAIWVGRLDYQKNPSEILKIWKKMTSNIQMFILGSGPLEQELKDKCVEYGLCDKVHFVGNTDPRKYYENATYICQTSLFEGLPMALIEALQYGCIPIIYDSYPAAKDFISLNNGVVIKNGNQDDFAAVLDSLSKDSALVASMSGACYTLASEYVVNEVIKKWIAVIDKFANKR